MVTRTVAGYTLTVLSPSEYGMDVGHARVRVYLIRPENWAISLIQPAVTNPEGKKDGGWEASICEGFDSLEAALNSLMVKWEPSQQED